jgi:hypothetical protein
MKALLLSQTFILSHFLTQFSKEGSSSVRKLDVQWLGPGACSIFQALFIRLPKLHSLVLRIDKRVYRDRSELAYLRLVKSTVTMCSPLSNKVEVHVANDPGRIMKGLARWAVKVNRSEMLPVTEDTKKVWQSDRQKLLASEIVSKNEDLEALHENTNTNYIQKLLASARPLKHETLRRLQEEFCCKSLRAMVHAERP